jgi:UDP-N-acetylglucosamine 4,6-dehydratase
VSQMHSLKDKIVLVTGGTGSLGSRLVHTLLNTIDYGVKKVIIFSRDELKQSEMNEMYLSSVQSGKLQFILGDIRDSGRLTQALKGVNVVFHTAALKHVPATENNPGECVKTNVMGAVNLIDACFQQQIDSVVALSTDKAALPESVYGASKLISDKLFIDANKEGTTKFSVVRFGNILGSRGSVLPLFMEQKQRGVLTVTDPNMTRFCITFSEAVDVLLFACENSLGGEIIVPKSPSFRIQDLANAVSEEAEKKYIGIRIGEKLHEDMITENDARYTWELDNYFILLPNEKSDNNFWSQSFNARKIKSDFCLRSDNNPIFLSKDEISILIERINSK